MTVDLMDMFQRHGYDDAFLFGHALEGNLHLVFSQGFRTPEELTRFHTMFDELCHIVATKHSGSLKGEHGTGRNVAPYVEMEWGELGRAHTWGPATHPLRLCCCGCRRAEVRQARAFAEIARAPSCAAHPHPPGAAACRHQGHRADVGAEGAV